MSQSSAGSPCLDQPVCAHSSWSKTPFLCQVIYLIFHNIIYEHTSNRDGHLLKKMQAYSLISSLQKTCIVGIIISNKCDGLEVKYDCLFSTPIKRLELPMYLRCTITTMTDTFPASND